ncbi:MAG TPA: hypothetical protein VJ904_03975 [Tichowtungia sp.]|nr:hypothetical protein [Tichowtungia sp.]
MKKTIRYRIIHIAGICMVALLFFAAGIEANETAQLTDETIVYYVPGKKRCHLADCRRRNETMSQMTWAEARAQGLKLCSRCPGSTTAGAPKKDKKDEVAQPSTTVQTNGPVVYYVPGKKRCHREGCRRISSDMQTMSLSEAKEKGLPFCSKCPAADEEEGTEKTGLPTP